MSKKFNLHTNVNVAYDLSLFEGQINEKRQPNIISVKKPKNKVRILPIIFILITGIIVAGSFIMGQLMMNEKVSQITKYQKELDNLKSEKVTYENELQTKTSLSNLEEYAKNNLNMIPNSIGQVEYISVSSNLSNIAEQKIDNNFNIIYFLDEIANFFKNIFNI
ncbi:MAG: hypothetical protein KFW09_03920 [Oscillospiraceae bacterium]|nr:hypothetical protein [Oscillospiraceae bacterium]